MSVNPTFPPVPGSTSALRYPAPSDQEAAGAVSQHRLKKATPTVQGQTAQFINGNKTDPAPLSILEGSLKELVEACSIFHVPKRMHDFFRGIDFPELLETDPLHMPVQQSDIRPPIVHRRPAEIKSGIRILRHGIHGAIAIEIKRES